jgi:uroporphyrin-III C-methyltransferase
MRNKTTSPSLQLMNPIGTCTLVGAGPGDPDLITMKAVKAIAAATVLLVDDLVNPELIRLYAKKDATVVYVGKRGGCISTHQRVIHHRMLVAVQEGEIVVRLKGGDPMIFGRSAEELTFLRDHGIEVTVINGITSGLAGATSIGIPLTHREYAHGVVFVTGHAKLDGNNLDWPKLAITANSLKLTLVIYMGIAEAEHIQNGLLKGMPLLTPVAIIQDATLETQRYVKCNLAQLKSTVDVHGLKSPAVIVIGDVVEVLKKLGQKALET